MVYVDDVLVMQKCPGSDDGVVEMVVCEAEVRWRVVI